MVVVAVAKAYCCNEFDVDMLCKCRDEQVKIVAAKRVSEVLNATIAETVHDETVPEEPQTHQFANWWSCPHRRNEGFSWAEQREHSEP